ncbi:hypothetical protein LOZ66_003320 [Ophidiomyces ophidiicola]|nr:hypothetical protein LOZ66_003320 [Ophidiomyces ophidiicola]
MDAQYPFASREDIWRVHEEVRDIYATQLEHEERLAKLERRKEDDARMRSLWGPFSPFPSASGHPSMQGMSHPIASGPGDSYRGSLLYTESAYNSPAEPFKGFDQGHQHNSAPGHPQLETEEEHRRGASRANSVRFDESSMHGYYSHANRSATEIAPLRTGSGLGNLSLTERSLSHRSDGNKSSSGQSQRTLSLGLEASRTDAPSTPGLFILGPVPCIIRCWLTSHFSNDSLLYAAVCSGSYSSAISQRLVQKLGLVGETNKKDGVPTIRLPVHLPEASVYQSSSRAGSPAPHLPAVTVQFVLRETNPSDEKEIQIFLGSDFLRLHNADILFSQDKILILDDEHKKISIPLVRPENYEMFKTLSTVSQPQCVITGNSRVNGNTRPIFEHENDDSEATSKPISPVLRKGSTYQPPGRTSSDSADTHPRRSANFAEHSEEQNSPDQAQSKYNANDKDPEKSPRMDSTGVWRPWRRELPASKSEPAPYLAAYQRSVRTRNMKVLKPSKPTSTSSRQVSGVAARPGGEPNQGTEQGGSPNTKPDSPWNTRSRSSNPVGGASAFGWLNTSQGKQGGSGAD